MKYSRNLTGIAVAVAAAMASILLSHGMAAAQSVTVYTAGPAGLASALTKGFTAKTNTKVELFQGTTGQVMARLAAETANPQCDVLISASWDSAEDFKAQGVLMDYTSPNAKNVPAALKDAAYVAQGAAALSIVWNSKSGKPKPTDWADLAKPDYKEAVTMPDPAASGSAYGLVSGLVADKKLGWKFFESLKANGAIVAGANAAALNPVMQGAKSAVFGAVDYIALTAQNKGEAIEVIYPKTGTVLEARPMMIFKTSKNVAQAKQFIDYVLSDEGQKLVADVYLLPARTDVAAKRPGWKDIKVLSENASESSQKRTETLAKFKTTMGVK